MLTHKKLLETLHYEPSSGEFTWIKNTGLKDLVGKKAGSINSIGYVNMSLFGKRYSAHRLAWFYCFEEWPEFNIDHIDGNRSNNSLDNLRDVTQSLNVVNSRLPLPKSGFKGVRASGSKWRAYAEKNGKHVGLGTYNTAEEASEAYIEYTQKRYENTI
jgi:hypothetical protein